MTAAQIECIKGIVEEAIEVRRKNNSDEAMIHFIDWAFKEANKPCADEVWVLFKNLH